MTRPLVLALALGSLLVTGCKKPEGGARPEASSTVSSASAAPSTTPPAPVHLAGDAERGRSLVEKFECSRCHDGTGVAAAPLEKHCVTCHQDIWADKFKAKPDKIAKWKKTVVHYLNAPSFENAGERLEPAFVAAFVLRPHKLRPNMVSTMPRLRISEQEAADVAAYLTRGAKTAAEPPSGDATAGRQVLETKACGTCHAFSGVPALPTKPALSTPWQKGNDAIELAPDLRFTRDRTTFGKLWRWLEDPAKVKPGTLMPKLGLTEKEAKDAAAYLLGAKLEPLAKKPVPARLPVLERKVTFEDVDREVLQKTCRHCHTNPDIARGDGGPGMTGGFGFIPRKLDFSTYESTNGGLLDLKGERMSVFTKTKDGTPLLVAALLARQKEEAGEIDPEARGMPLGLPALTAEQVQIVESWVAQGRPQ
ncbi:MAG: c-type cytochrome [Polyangiaceae bacterium]|nr:c-type cytochrome [Polyangiaceae bacterium]